VIELEVRGVGVIGQIPEESDEEPITIAVEDFAVREENLRERAGVPVEEQRLPEGTAFPGFEGVESAVALFRPFEPDRALTGPA
jgi:hypothetical protein